MGEALLAGRANSLRGAGGVCFILPRFGADSADHYVHLPELLAQVANRVPVRLVVERGSGVALDARLAPYRQKFQFLPLRFLELCAALLVARTQGYRLFYAHYTYPGALAAAMVSRICGGVSFYWNCGEPKQFEIPWRLSLTALGRKLSTDLPLKLALKTTHYLVTGTESMARYYAFEYGLSRQRIRVVPNSISLERFRRECWDKKRARERLEIPSGALVGLFVHRLSERKGAHRLVALADRIRREGVDLCLEVVGDGPLRASIEREVRERELGGTIRVHGNVPNRDVLLYYAAADFLLMPSAEEGFPRVLIEAMAMGVPFVATDVGGVRDMVPPSYRGRLVPRDAELRFVERVLELRSEALRRQLAEEGLEWVKRYDVEPVAEIFHREIVEGQ